METETPHAPSSEFGHSPWMDLGAFTSPQHSPPMPGYSGFEYGTSPLMGVDASYGMSIPPPYASIPLAMPSHSWPSMLTTQSPFHESGMPPAPGPTSTSPSARMPPIRKTSTGGSTPRRTLTDEDRRRMCLYHEENKTAKQTDIGALFGVERSTVSKVLRQKEKYLNPDDGSRSPIKRAKGRVPDIEKAMSNWARNYQRRGFSLNDEMIKEKALFFASTCGCPEGKEKVLTTSWVEKFKHKNNLLGSMSRKGSTDTRSGSTSPTRNNTDSTGDSAVQSPSGHSSSSGLSPTQSLECKKELADGVPDLAGGYQHDHSKSTTSLDTASLAEMASPTSTLLSDSPFTPTSQSRPLAIPPDGNHTSRPRSQTFPSMPIDPTLLSADETLDSQRTKLSVLESPLEMDDQKDGAFDQSNVIKRNRSNPEIKSKSMQPPAKSNTGSPVTSLPTQNEARKALALLMNYFKHQSIGLAPDDYLIIGKMMGWLDLSKRQQSMLLGGLTRIDEQ